MKTLYKLSLVLLIVFCVAPAAAQTFSEQLNPTGDPIGGGPGYTGAWRTAQGHAGQGIYTEEDADHVVTTEAELRAVALSYRDRATNADSSGSTPALSGEVVFLKGNAERVLTLTNTIGINFNSGVIVASDLGLDNGDGTYSLGTTVRVPDLWGNRGLGVFTATTGWRLTGIVLDGPSSYGMISNGGYTDGWLGIGLGYRADIGSYSEIPEVDNVWFIGFPYMGVNLYRGPALVHHVRVMYSRLQGYGYGIYPGRDVTDKDGVSPLQHAVGFWLHAFRHGTDGISAGFDANGDSEDETEFRYESAVVTGHNRNAVFNTHAQTDPDGSSGAEYGAYLLTYSRLAELDERTGSGVKAGWPPPAGSLQVDHLWGIGGSVGADGTPTATFDEFEAGTATEPAIMGVVEIDHATRDSDGSEIVQPVLSCSLDQTEITAGESVTLTLDATDADGHSMLYYEILPGNTSSAKEGIIWKFPTDSSATITYSNPGHYKIKIRGVNEYGVVGHQLLGLDVKPVDTTSPIFTFRISPEIHPTGPDKSGFYEGRVLMNGQVIYTFDVGDLNNRGYRDVAVDVSTALDGAVDFTLGLETEVLQTITDPQNADPSNQNGSEIGQTAFYVDNVRLWNDGGLRVAGAAWQEMDPDFDEARGELTVEYEWGAEGTARVRLYDTPSDQGGVLSIHTTDTTAGAVKSYTSKTRPYMRPPTSVSITRTNGDADLDVTWTQANGTMRDRARIRVFRAVDDVVVHDTTVTDSGAYTWAIASNDSIYADVHYVAPKWDNAGIDVASRATQSTPAAPVLAWVTSLVGGATGSVADLGGNRHRLRTTGAGGLHADSAVAALRLRSASAQDSVTAQIDSLAFGAVAGYYGGAGVGAADTTTATASSAWLSYTRGGWVLLYERLTGGLDKAPTSVGAYASPPCLKAK